MSSIPYVSVVMPTFNRARELKRSISSVLLQSFSNLELIIVDDASTDDTDNVIRAIEDRRVRYIKLPENVGAAEARNIGIRLSRGSIIAFQDSDDEWTSLKLEKSIEAFEDDSSVGAVFSTFIQVSDSGCHMMPTGISQFRQDQAYESLLKQNFVDTPTLVVKKFFLEKVDGFDPTMPRYQDWELALRLVKITAIRCIYEPLIISYVSNESITRNESAHKVALVKIYDKHILNINQSRALKASWQYLLGDAQMKEGERSGRSLLLKAFIAFPFKPSYCIKAMFALPGSFVLYNYMLSFCSKLVGR